MRRFLIAVFVCLAVAGCSAPPRPDVTFYADGHSVRVFPLVLCDLAARTCDERPEDIKKLAMRPGKTAQISVSSAVASGPWAVVFSYVDRDGQRNDASSRLFLPDNGVHAYTLELPHADDRLVLAAVQKVAIVNGDQRVVTGYWVIDATP